MHGRTQPSGKGGGGGGGGRNFIKGDLSSRKIMDYVIRPIQRARGGGGGGGTVRLRPIERAGGGGGGVLSAYARKVNSSVQVE